MAIIDWTITREALAEQATRADQAQKDRLKDNRVTEEQFTCEVCEKRLGKPQICPYNREIFGTRIERVLCAVCRQRALDDIGPTKAKRPTWVDAPFDREGCRGTSPGLTTLLIPRRPHHWPLFSALPYLVAPFQALSPRGFWPSRSIHPPSNPV